VSERPLTAKAFADMNNRLFIVPSPVSQVAANMESIRTWDQGSHSEKRVCPTACIAFDCAERGLAVSVAKARSQQCASLGERTPEGKSGRCWAAD